MKKIVIAERKKKVWIGSENGTKIEKRTYPLE